MQLSTLLPPTSEGYLPIWLWVVASTALVNGIVNLLTPDDEGAAAKKSARPTANPSHKVYSSPKGQTSSTALTARLFGTWNVLSALVRFAAAYEPNNKSVYALCAATFALALMHFGTEAVNWGNIDVRKVGSASPFVVASVSLTWMVAQWGHYAKGA